MNGRQWALRLVLLTTAFTLATVWFGWWSVPVLGVAWGLVGRGGRPAVEGGLAAGAGWGLLLLWSARVGPVGTLAQKLGALAHVPGAVFIGLTLVLPSLLAVTAAWLASSRSRPARPPHPAGPAGPGAAARG